MTDSSLHRESWASRSRSLIALLILLATSCGRKPKALPWATTKLTRLEVGPYTIPIPADWRALSDLRDPSAGIDPGTLGITPERLEGGALRANVIFTWSPITGPRPTCAAFASQVAAQQQGTPSEVTTRSLEGDVVCRFQVATSEANQVSLVRFHGDHQLVAVWTRMTSLGSHDASGDAAVWDSVLGDLHVLATRT